MASSVYKRKKFKVDTCEYTFDVFLRALYMGWNIQIAKQYAVYNLERKCQSGGGGAPFRTPEGWYCSIYTNFRWNGTGWSQERSLLGIPKPDPETGIITEVSEEPVIGPQTGLWLPGDSDDGPGEIGDWERDEQGKVKTVTRTETKQCSKRANNGSAYGRYTTALDGSQTWDPHYRKPPNPYKDNPDPPLVWETPWELQEEHIKRPPKKVPSRFNPTGFYLSQGDPIKVEGSNPHTNPATFDRITDYCWGLTFSNQKEIFLREDFPKVKLAGDLKVPEEAAEAGLPTSFQRYLLDYLKLIHPELITNHFLRQDTTFQEMERWLVMADWMEEQGMHGCEVIRKLFGG